MKVLIIDDDPLIREMYLLRFQQAGVEVELVTDGTQGFEKIASTDADAVLLDIVLPRLDGFGILEKLKSLGKTHPPIILLTNLGQKEDVDRGLALGAVDYIIKAHFTPTEVLEKVRAVAAGSKKET